MSADVWLLCMTSERHVFPNLSVLGVFSSKQKALDTLATLPPHTTYILYHTPMDTFLGFFTKSGTLKDGMGQLQHEHFDPRSRDVDAD